MKKYQNSIQKDIVHIISNTKKIKPKVILGRKQLDLLGFDLVDIVDIILKVERTFNIIIPDSLPINTVDDIVSYVSVQTHGAYIHSLQTKV